MTAPHFNARRRFMKDNPLPSTPLPCLTLQTQDTCQNYPDERNLPLRKSATFHSPTSPPDQEDDPILNISRLPKRSPTCPKALEDAVAAGEKRAANILGVFEHNLPGSRDSSSDSMRILGVEDLPVPGFLIKAHVGGLDCMDIDQPDDHHHINPSRGRRQAHKHHSSDSGIGSTVTDSEDINEPHIKLEKTSPLSSVHEIQSGINGSTTNAGPQIATPHVLSEAACRKINEHIIVPIVRDNSLKNYHRFVTSIPYRVARKEITCLRDLEKVLLFLAPKWSVSRASFIEFCEASIQCIHTTVEYLNEPDQRRPTDAPYTNGYFLDLTEQMRQYAAMITASRERLAAGRAPTEDDYTTDETVRLEGGLSQTGRPAELVKIKNGKTISLRTGSEFQPQPNPEFDTSMEDGVDDLTRSMARRRKSAPTVVKNVECSECQKQFKRPCDLTKHEKTHSRPWKCSEPSCKYHTYGWPTEKEKDRHVNDKHSATPSMHKCKYPPCPYESKRESNCKQHMEKAHGWAYIRSKNNGKTDRKAPRVKNPSSQSNTTPASSIFEVSSPEFGEVPSPPVSYGGFPVTRSVNGSVAGSDESIPQSTSDNDWMDPAFAPLTPDFPYGQIQDFSPVSLQHHSWDDPSIDISNIPPHFDATSPALEMDPIFNNNFDWSNLNDFSSFNLQLHTPANSVDNLSFDPYSRIPSVSLKHPPSGQIPSLSPGAQGNVMFYSPFSNTDSAIDEGYDEFAGDLRKPGTDFPLFEESKVSSAGAAGMMFQELESIQNSWPGRVADFGHHFVLQEETMQVDDE